jgi:hypothetical protein
MLGRRIIVLLGSFMVTAALHAQALPAASRSLSFEAGAGVSFANPDFTDPYIKGISIFGSADFRKGLGVDVEYHDTNIITPHDIGEQTFLGGLRYGVHKRKFYPYVKGLAGIGTFNFQQGYYNVASSKNYSVFALGGGIEYHASERISIRLIDMEYQEWTTFSPSNLTPIVYTIGAAYRFR